MTEIVIKSKKDSSNLIIIDGQIKADLCRCGKSKTMPFCDSTHRICNFKAGECETRIIVPEDSQTDRESK